MSAEPKPQMHRGGKRVVNVRRWRIAFLYGGRYRFGGRLKRIGPHVVGFDAGLGLVVVNAIRRSR